MAGSSSAGTRSASARSSAREKEDIFQGVQSQPLCTPELFVSRWLDISKFGTGYLLSDGSMGICFNDSTKAILAPDGQHFDYITHKTQYKEAIRTSHTLEAYPEDHKKKVTLLRLFQRYLLADVIKKMEGAIFGDSRLTALSKSPARTLSDHNNLPVLAPYVKKVARDDRAVMFQFSNNMEQVIFLDKAEVVVSPNSHLITYYDKIGTMCSYFLSEGLEVPNGELAAKLRYMHKILVPLLGAR